MVIVSHFNLEKICFIYYMFIGISHHSFIYVIIIIPVTYSIHYNSIILHTIKHSKLIYFIIMHFFSYSE
jgi:hypothetical protein